MSAKEQEVKHQVSTLKDDKAFGAALTKAKKGVGEAFDLLQSCILYGLTKYQAHSADASYLSRAMQMCETMPGTNPAQVKAYIQEHANVTYRQAPDGSKKFGKVGKGPAVVTMPEDGYNWYNQKSEAIIVRPDMVDPVAELQKLFDRLKEKETKGKIPQSRLDKFHELQAQLAPVLEMDKLDRKELFSKPEAAEPEAQADEKKAA